jgi:hypothetical protein
MFEIIVVILLLFIAIEIKLYNNKKYLKTMHNIVLLIFVWEKKMIVVKKNIYNYYAFFNVFTHLRNSILQHNVIVDEYEIVLFTFYGCVIRTADYVIEANQCYQPNTDLYSMILVMSTSTINKVPIVLH